MSSKLNCSVQSSSFSIFRTIDIGLIVIRFEKIPKAFDGSSNPALAKFDNPKIKMMRVNGVEKTQTGILNQSAWGLLNHKIYVGARGGTSLFLTSKVRSIAFIGRVLTNTEIENIESLLIP